MTFIRKPFALAERENVAVILARTSSKLFESNLGKEPLSNHPWLLNSSLTQFSIKAYPDMFARRCKLPSQS